MDREQLQAMIDRRNKFVGEAEGLRKRLAVLEREIAAADAEIHRSVG
jgi:hypothetical protein